MLAPHHIFQDSKENVKSVLPTKTSKFNYFTPGIRIFVENSEIHFFESGFSVIDIIF